MFILKIYLINLLFTNIIFFEHNIMFIDKILFKFVKGVSPSLFHDVMMTTTTDRVNDAIFHLHSASWLACKRNLNCLYLP